MFKRSYVIGTVENVKNFVNATSNYIEDIDLVKGRYVVDAKSIMGIFSLDLSKPIEMRIYTEDAVRAEEIFEKIDNVLRG